MCQRNAFVAYLPPLDQVDIHVYFQVDVKVNMYAFHNSNRAYISKVPRRPHCIRRFNESLMASSSTCLNRKVQVYNQLRF